MAATLTVVTATKGRPTLSDTALSVIGQLQPGDEWLVVGDGNQPSAALLASQWPGVRYLETAPTANWGNSQREMGLRQAHGSHVLYVDDDDVLVSGSLALVRAAVEAQPSMVHLFRTHYQNHRGVKNRVLWERPKVHVGNVGTGMVVTPSSVQASWVWPDATAYVADHNFIKQAADEIGVTWHEDVIQIISPYPTNGR